MAETICIFNGCHLVSIHSATEDTFIRDTIVGFNAYYWIGLFAPGGCCAALGSCCIYNWYDGTPFDYMMGWVPFAPGSSRGSCAYGINVANHTIGWDNDQDFITCTGGAPCASCTVELEFVCESTIMISVG